MFQHLLVPLDGSPRAEQVLSVATRLAHITGATVTLLTVVDLAREAFTYRMAGPFLPPDTFEKDLTAARGYLDQVAQRVDMAGILLKKQVGIGNPATLILSHAEALTRQPIDLIVMSSHGYTGVKRWILGSVAEQVARYAPVPVLLLREEEPLHTHTRMDGMHALRALVPLDTSARSLDALPPAAELVSAFSSPEHGQLQLTQIVVVPEHASKAEREGLLCSAREHIQAVGQSISEGLVTHIGPDLHLKLSYAVSIDSSIAGGIVRLAEDGEPFAEAGDAQRCDLIALTTHGMTGAHRWAIGSITEKVLNTTRLPLLIVRPADRIEQERDKRKSQAQAIV